MTYSILDCGSDKEEGVFASSLFWFALALGRLFGMLFSSKFSSFQQLNFQLLGLLVTNVIQTALILTELSCLQAVLWGSFFYGLLMSTLFPLFMDVPG